MAEKRFHDYKRPVVAFDENERFLGLLQPGRYRGFDTFVPSGLNFSVNHSGTGIEKVDIVLAVGSKTGILVTTQGGIIHEDASKGPFTVSTNVGNGVKRMDILIYEHEFLASPGGQAGIYSVIEGAIGDPNPPALSAPEKQIIIGYIEIPANAANLNDAVYTPVETPALGNSNTARRNARNKFSQAQEFNQCAVDVTTATSIDTNRFGIDIPKDGNTIAVDYATTGLEAINAFRLEPEGDGTLIRTWQPGTRIVMYAKDAFALGDWRVMPITNTDYDNGYREIETITDTIGLGYHGVEDDDIVEFELVNTGAVSRPHKFIMVSHSRAYDRALVTLSATVTTLSGYVQPAWVNISTFGTNYAAGTPVPQVKYDFATVQKMVFCRGRISRSPGLSLAGSTPVHLCTVPAGYEPAARRYISLYSTTGTMGTSVFAMGYVDTDGKIYVIPNSIQTGFNATTDSIALDIHYAL